MVLLLEIWRRQILLFIIIIIMLCKGNAQYPLLLGLLKSTTLLCKDTRVHDTLAFSICEVTEKERVLLLGGKNWRANMDEVTM